jgi:hypothetical protein
MRNSSRFPNRTSTLEGMSPRNSGFDRPTARGSAKSKAMGIPRALLALCVPHEGGEVQEPGPRESFQVQVPPGVLTAGAEVGEHGSLVVRSHQDDRAARGHGFAYQSVLDTRFLQDLGVAPAQLVHAHGPTVDCRLHGLRRGRVTPPQPGHSAQGVGAAAARNVGVSGDHGQDLLHPLRIHEVHGALGRSGPLEELKIHGGYEIQKRVAKAEDRVHLRGPPSRFVDTAPARVL